MTGNLQRRSEKTFSQKQGKRKEGQIKSDEHTNAVLMLGSMQSQEDEP